jgi:hypothetical protein
VGTLGEGFGGTEAGTGDGRGARGGGVCEPTDTGLSLSSLGVLPGSDGPKTGLRVSPLLFPGTGITNTGLGTGTGVLGGVLGSALERVGTPIDGAPVGKGVPTREKLERGSSSIPFCSS